MMKTFAFLLHQSGFKKSLQVFPIEKVRSVREKEIEGQLVVFYDKDSLLDKVIEGCELAKKLGAKILGVGGCSAALGDKIYSVTKRLKLPITTGDSFSAWSIFEAVYRLARQKNIDLGKTTLAIIGACSSLGYLVSKKFSSYLERIVINDNDLNRLKELKEVVAHLNPIEIVIQTDAHQAVKDAEIVVVINSQPDGVLKIQDLRPNTIICDLSFPKGIIKMKNLGRDITLINGGLIKMPYPAKFAINIGLPKGIIPAGLAETMLLAFEERFISYSLGNAINLDKIEEIADIAVGHGFEVWLPEAPVL